MSLLDALNGTNHVEAEKERQRLFALQQEQESQVNLPGEPTVTSRPQWSKLEQMQHEAEKDVVYTATFSVDLATQAAGGKLGDYHLPDEVAIQSFYIENPGASAKIAVYMGTGGATGQGAKACNDVKPGQFVKGVVGTDIRSISLVSSGADTGFVVIAITSKLWAPARGTV